MKKGLFFALLMVAVVAMAFPAAGRAPIIKDLPDIIIGDATDIDPGTTAARLYRYLNVLNVFQSNVIEWRNGFANDKKSVFMYRDTAVPAPIDIRLSKPTAFVNTLSLAQFTALAASGTQPPAGTNAIDAATTFGFLSFMNMDIVTGTPTSAYTATPAANGMADASIPSNKLGRTDLVLAAAEVIDWPTTPTLVDTKAFTVYTVHASADYTSGLVEVVRNDQFVGGSNDGWYGRTNMGLADFGNATTAVDATAGAIGWNATGTGGGTSGANYGTWYLSDDGVTPKFLIPGAGMEDKVYRVRFGLTSTATTRAATCSWRMFAISYEQTSLQGIQVLTIGTEGAVDAPLASTPLAAQIHFAVPYELGEWGTGEALDTATPVAQAADFRNFTLNFDGIDLADDGGILLMDSCVIESYPRPASVTPAIQWGGAGNIAFNDPNNGFAGPTAVDPSLATLLTLGTFLADANSVTLTMGNMASTPAKWQQAGLNLAGWTNAAKYAETAGELVRYTVECESANPDIAPNVRFQTTAAEGTTVDNTRYWNSFGASLGGIRTVIANTASVIQPSAPRSAANGGSTLELYRYILNTTGSRFLAFNWDCYGVAAAGTGWLAQTGAFTVTSLKLEGGLVNP